jgi:hypothetical protein
MSAAAKRWVDRVANLPCLVCELMALKQESRTHVHHCFDTAHRSDFLVVPLCHEHHQGATGFHGLGARAFNACYKTDETHLIAETIRRIAAMR